MAGDESWEDEGLKRELALYDHSGSVMRTCGRVRTALSGRPFATPLQYFLKPPLPTRRTTGVGAMPFQELWRVVAVFKSGGRKCQSRADFHTNSTFTPSDHPHKPMEVLSERP